ncbi:MAG TPA: hypothetical protein VK817_15215 [Trebonia sp.]|jgi:hypothetical protein|nr:hypothetical protein [Trebonia sp.]
MSDISVDLDMLNQTATQLNTLVNDFQNAAKIVSSAGINDPTIGKALDNFTGDWKVKVGDLISSMQSVQKMASQGYQGYTSTDNQLASDLKNGGSQ